MTTRSDTDRLVDEYLRSADRALASLPAAQRRQVVDELAAHIDEARKSIGPDDEVGLRNALERLGDPALIACEVGVENSSEAPARIDRWIPWLLLLGGFAFFVGWVIGAALLWRSSAWRTRDKLIGTLVIPGGLATPFLVAGAGAPSRSCGGSGGAGHQVVEHCTTSGFSLSWPIGLLVLGVGTIAPLVVFWHLARARRL